MATQFEIIHKEPKIGKGFWINTRNCKVIMSGNWFHVAFAREHVDMFHLSESTKAILMAKDSSFRSIYSAMRQDGWASLHVYIDEMFADERLDESAKGLIIEFSRLYGGRVFFTHRD